METEINIAWSTPKSDDFNLREFAFSVLELARENLEKDGELLPTVFFVTSNSIECAPVNFADHDEKTRVYSAVIEKAKGQGAVALITVNNMFMRDDFDTDQLESYYPGKLEADGTPECILITTSGPGIKNWSLELPYVPINERFEFGDISEQSGGEIGFLMGWATEEPKVQ